MVNRGKILSSSYWLAGWLDGWTAGEGLKQSSSDFHTCSPKALSSAGVLQRVMALHFSQAKRRPQTDVINQAACRPWRQPGR